MAVYRIRKDSLYLYELPLFGSSRLGVIKENKLLKVKTAQNNIGVMSLPIPVNIAQSKNTPKPVVYTMGKKHYESVDWLGNVRVTYTDKKSWQQNKFALNISSSQDYYPFGSVMEGRGFSYGLYRWGFSGQEKMNEVYSFNNFYDLGERFFDPRIIRMPSLDPLMKKNATWSPYIFALDNPLVFVDEKGKWPGVKYFYFELDVGLGLGYGLNYVDQSGIAYDEVGKTHFTMTSALYIFNQNLKEESIDPQVVAGISASLSFGFTFDWSHKTFLGDISRYNGEMGGFEIYKAIGGEIGFGEKRFTMKIGLGAGIKISVINTKVKQSISLTDEEADIVSNSTDLTIESWIIDPTKILEIKNKNGDVTGYKTNVFTRNSKGEMIDTGITVYSDAITNEDGKSEPSNIWTSKNYKKEAEKIDQNN